MTKFVIVQAGIDCVWILLRHRPEGIFDDHQGVMSIAHHVYESNGFCRFSWLDASLNQQFTVSSDVPRSQVFALHISDPANEIVLKNANRLPEYILPAGFVSHLSMDGYITKSGTCS